MLARKERKEGMIKIKKMKRVIKKKEDIFKKWEIVGDKERMPLGYEKM